jgi:predicted polyphosphate/ATP-dependent NAD kinase
MNPSKAANLVMQFLWDEAPLKEEEVMDIDENAFREGELVSKLYGYMLVPYNPEFSQMSKTCSPDSDQANQERIAKKVVQDLKEDVFYLIGPGTTTKAITDRLEEEKTVLGVDLLLNKEIITQDLNESQILEYVREKPTMIIVSPIGNQGFIFGRGNLQFTPKIIQEVGKKNIIIVSTKHKLNNIQGGVLRVDTRDPDTDEYLRGFYKVIIDFDEIRICKVE